MPLFLINHVKDDSHREEQDPELSVLQLLPGDEPGGEGGHQHADEGGLVGGDVVGDPRVVHRQVRQGLVNILRTERGLYQPKNLVN